MPTAMKKRPSSRPLNGSMSVSSSRRYSLSASSTPARKAPSAIDRPTACISAAVATTSSSAAAVKISGVSLRAIQRSAGRSSRRPPSTMRGDHADALRGAEPAAAVAVPSAPAPASSGSSARIGIAATSCSSATLRTLCPRSCAQQVALGQHAAGAIAVDDSARPSAATSASAPVDAGEQRDAGKQQRPSRTAARCPSRRSACAGPQPPRLELEADQEQHQHDAELGEVQHVLRVGDEPQAPGPDHDAGGR